MKRHEQMGADSGEENLLNQLWFKYFPYWPLFLILVFLAAGGAWVYLLYKAPMYSAHASILIKDEKKGQDDSKMIESLNQLSSKKIIENETEVLSSRVLMYEVTKKLHLYAPVYEKGKTKPVTAYVTSPIHIAVSNPDSLVESGKIYFKYDPATKQVAIDGKSYPVNEFVKTPYGELKFISQSSASTRLTPMYFTLIDPKKVTSGLVNRLKISSAGKLSSVINLKMTDESPKCAEDILNELILAYNWASINDKNTLAANTLTFIEERLNFVVKDLDSIEKKLQQYKATRGAIDIGSQGTLFLQNVSAVDQRLGDVNTQLAVLNQVENYVKAKDKSGGIVPSTVGVTDPMLSQLLTKLYDNELQYENLKKTTGENNPVIVSITDQIDKIKPSILENIQSQKVSLEANRNNLSSTINHFSSMLQSIPQKERDLVEISREQNVKSSIYNFLLQKREETGLSLSSSISDSRIVDKAQASFGPVSPRKKLIYLIFILAAVVLAVGLVTTNEMLKRTIMFRQEIESYTSIPVIGEIVFDKSRTPLVIGNGKRTFIAEQFRSLRTSLPYIGLNSNKKKLLVTSTVSGEGKSFIVANLGISLALAGKKVVVLEFDLSDPTLSEKLSFTGSKGLTDYLSGNAEPEEIVRRTAVHENLFIMPAGPLPDNPSEMIMSEKVPELMQYLSEIFDYIILDTAPVGLLSDAYILTAYCDATLYVVRHRRTRKVSIERLDENNKINELKNMGIVFNGVRARGFNKNGYGYGYGYGYIFNEKKKRKKKEGTHDTVA